MDLREVLAWVLLAMPIFPLAQFVVLIEHTWSDNIWLRERTTATIIHLLASVAVALVAANFLFEWGIPDGLRAALFVAAVLALTIPSVIWLVIFVRDGS